MSSFESVADFFAMSGYGKYVWPCMLLGFGVVVLNAWLAVRALADAPSGLTAPFATSPRAR